jgi:uncharacterized membrane protein
MLLTRSQLMRAIDRETIERALEAAELGTTGEIRVSVAPFFWGDVRAAAERAFDRLGMAATRDRNGVLLFVVPARRRFVVLGDRGIHERMEEGFWERVTAVIAQRFRAGDYNGGLLRGIEALGRELAVHFPLGSDPDVDELPSAIDFDG